MVSPGLSGSNPLASTRIVCRNIAFALVLLICGTSDARAQLVSQRGFVDVRGTAFPQETPNDSTRAVGDALLREDLFVKPLPWLQIAVGAAARFDSHDQVADDWRPARADRGPRRPRLSLRRASATVA